MAAVAPVGASSDGRLQAPSPDSATGAGVASGVGDVVAVTMTVIICTGCVGALAAGATVEVVASVVAVGGTGVAVGAAVGVSVGVAAGVGVNVGVSVGSGVGVGVAVGSRVGAAVAVGACVGVGVGVDVGIEVAVGTGVNVGVSVGSGVGVAVGVGVWVAVGVVVGWDVGVGVGVGRFPICGPNSHQVATPSLFVSTFNIGYWIEVPKFQTSSTPVVGSKSLSALSKSIFQFS